MNTTPHTCGTKPMHTSLVQFANGGFEMVCPETYKGGFTNHRVSIIRSTQGFTCSDSRAVCRHETVPDLAGVAAWLRIERCVANPHIAEAAKAALAHVSA